MKRNTWISLIAATVIAVLVMAFLHYFEYVTTELAGEPSGPASYNSLYALEQLLRQLDIPAHSRAWLDLEETPPETYATIVTAADPAMLGEAQTDALLAWVEDGGHLVVALPASSEMETGSLLSKLGVRLLETANDSRCPALSLTTIDAAPEVLEGCGFNRFEVTDSKPLLALHDEQGLLFARLAYGAGAVSVVSSLRFADNHRLRKTVNSRFALLVLQPNLGLGPVDLVYSIEAESLLRLLLRHAWQALFAFGLLVLAWLYARMRRFGPVSGDDERPRRALLEHVSASARFMERNGLSENLRLASEQRFMQLLYRRRNDIAMLPPASRHRVLASLTGMKENDIRRAFTQADQPLAAAERIMLLAQLGKML